MILLLLLFSFTIQSSLLAQLTWKSLNQELDEISEGLYKTKNKREQIRLFDFENLTENLWQAYNTITNGSYKDDANIVNFKKNAYDSIVHNLEYRQGLHPYKIGLNKYSYMSPDQMNKVMNRYISGKKNSIQKTRYPTNIYTNSSTINDKRVDWRLLGVVSRIRDQNTCGSCYAFSAIGSLESMYALRHHGLLNFSYQELVDCTFDFGNFGCSGGTLENAFEYVIKNKGIQRDEDYVYKAKTDTCQRNQTLTVPMNITITSVKENDEIALMNALATYGPISIAIDCSSPKFLSYSSGVYVDEKCSSSNPNHAMLLVGYGIANAQNHARPFWLIKNSWGDSWGENGYIRIARLHKNMCGVASDAVFPRLV